MQGKMNIISLQENPAPPNSLKTAQTIALLDWKFVVIHQIDSNIRY